LSCEVQRRDAVITHVAEQAAVARVGRKRRLGFEEHRLPEEASNR
jgi:hypothetical protein